MLSKYNPNSFFPWKVSFTIDLLQDHFVFVDKTYHGEGKEKEGDLNSISNT